MRTRTDRLIENAIDAGLLDLADAAIHALDALEVVVCATNAPGSHPIVGYLADLSPPAFPAIWRADGSNTIRGEPLPLDLLLP